MGLARIVTPYRMILSCSENWSAGDGLSPGAFNANSSQPVRASRQSALSVEPRKGSARRFAGLRGRAIGEKNGFPELPPDSGLAKIFLWREHGGTKSDQ